jgi:WD40 repeat protein
MTGKLVEHFDLGACGAIVTAVSEVSLLARTTNSSDCFNLETRQDVAVELIALDSGSRQLLSAAAQLTDGGALSRDGNYVAFDDLTGTEPLSVVVDTRSGERTLTIPQRQGQLDSWVRALNADGSLLLYGDRPIQVWDVSRRELATSFDGHAGESFYAEFGPAGDTVYSTGRDSTLRHWVARSGEPLSVAARVGAGRPAPTESGMVMVTGLDTASAALVDTRLRGEITAAETCDGFAVAGGLGVTKSLASLYIACDDVEGTTAVVDLDTSRSVYELPGQQGQAIRVSADGSRFVRQEGTELMVGPITVRDLRTGEEILELQGICTWDRNLVEPEETEGCSAYPEQPFPVWAWQLEWSPDGSMVAAVNQISFVSLVWDATTGRLLFADDASAFDIIFSPDSEELVIVHGTQLDVGLRLISTDSWQVTLETPVTELTLDAFPNIGFIGYSSDGTSIRALAGLYGSEAGTLFSVNAATLEVESIKERIHDGSPKSVAMSPNGELVATGSSDGFIRVWDATSWALVHEISVDDTQIQGLAFVNDLHLAFAPQSGNVYVVTIDTAELLDIARASLTRTFTPTECERFNFGDDCPTLEQLRNDSAIDG